MSLYRSSSAPARNVPPSQALLNDLCSRFVLNAPREELRSFERICFLIEQAHWFYEDNSVEQNPSLKSLTLKEFTSLMFSSCDSLRPYISHIDDIYDGFTSYKIRVPVTGAIILEDSYERCLLVKGWKAAASWSFPRGKKNKDEEDHTCAIREVLEETGFDVSKLLKIDEYIEVVIGEQRQRLYIITGVKKDTVFAPLTKKEISEISWYRIDDLLPASNEAVSRGVGGLKLYMVAPFLASLRAWISTHRPQVSSRGVPSRKTTDMPGGNLSNLEITVGRGADFGASDKGPGKSFRTFRFDIAHILRSMETGFFSGSGRVDKPCL